MPTGDLVTTESESLEAIEIGRRESLEAIRSASAHREAAEPSEPVPDTQDPEALVEWCRKRLAALAALGGQNELRAIDMLLKAIDRQRETKTTTRAERLEALRGALRAPDDVLSAELAAAGWRRG